MPETWKNQNLILKEGTTSNARKAYEYFLGKGLSPNQSAGIVGNLAQESTLKLDSGIEEVTPRKDKGFGIAQWTFSRRDDLNKFAKTKNKQVSDLGTQLDFIWEELNTTEKRAFKKLKETKSPEEAAIVFNKNYERSADASDPSSKAYNNRIKFANRFSNSFTGLGDINDPNSSQFSNTQVAESTPNYNMELEFFNEVVDTGKVIDKKTQEVQKEIDSRVATANLQNKIKERDFLKSLIENTQVDFIKRK